MKRLFLLLLLSTGIAGCGTFAPVGALFEIGEASRSQATVDEHPDTIETTVTKDNGQIKVVSNSSKSVVQQPIPQPKFNTEKAIEGVPTWLIVFNVILGVLVFINSYRSYHSKKRGDV